MKKILFLIAMMMSSFAHASEHIYIMSPYSSGHSGSAALLRIIDEANRSQKKYKLHLESKPGGEQSVAVKLLDEGKNNRLAVIAPKFVEHVVSKKLTDTDYTPIYSLGDACWAVITNVGDQNIGVDSLKTVKTLNVGGVGLGNATHLTSLMLAEKYGFQVNYVVFKANFDSLVDLAGIGNINLTTERPEVYLQMKEKNPKIQALALSCPTQVPELPGIKTLKEQGIDGPFVFNIVISHKDMDPDRKKELGEILNSATLTIGKDPIKQISGMIPPVFYQQTAENHYKNSIEKFKSLLDKYSNKLNKK